MSDWASDFWWVGVFVDSTPTERQLRARLSVLADVATLRPGSPEELTVLAREVIAAASPDRVVWVAANAHGTDEAWHEAWTRFALDLNESRERLVVRRGGLVLVGPLAWKAETREHAPDLWALRNAVLDVDDVAPAPPPRKTEDGASAAAPVVLAVAAEPSTSRGLALLDEAEEALLRSELHEAERLAREALSHLEGRQRPGAARGWETLAKAALRDDDATVARGAAAHAVEHLKAELAERATPDTRRALMIATSLLADATWAEAPTARALSEVLELRREGVAHARNARSDLGDRPDVLRDLSVSLERLGGCLVLCGGAPEQARALLQEAASLGEQLNTEWPQLVPRYDPSVPRSWLERLDGGVG
ncbi:MAG: hypothetical protein ACQEXJ_10325 [Myxococcota bacterium]